MQTDLDQLDFDLRALRDRSRRQQVLALPFFEHDEMVEMQVLFPDEVEAAPRLLLQLHEP